MSRNTYSSEEEDSHEQGGQGAICVVSVPLLIFPIGVPVSVLTHRVSTIPWRVFSILFGVVHVCQQPLLLLQKLGITTMMDFWLTITSLRNLSGISSYEQDRQDAQKQYPPEEGEFGFTEEEPKCDGEESTFIKQQN